MASRICGPVTAEQKEHLARIRRSERDLIGLIADILGCVRAKSISPMLLATYETRPLAPAGVG